MLQLLKGGQLGQLQPQLYCRAGRTNIDVDVLLRVSWSGCMPDTSDTHIQVTAAAVQAVQEVALKGSTSPIKT